MKLRGFGASLIFGAIVIYTFVNMMSAGGPLENLTGMLISRYPFHRQIAEAFAGGLGYEISMIPATGFSWLDELNVLLIAIILSGGISATLSHIFCPEGMGIKVLAVSVLSSIVTILTASFLFGGLALRMNQSLGGKLIWPVLKLLMLAGLLLIFYLFVKAAAGLVKGEAGLGLLGFFALRAVVRTAALDVMSVYVLLSILNRAEAIAVPLIVAYVILMLAAFVGGNLYRAGSGN